MGGGHVVMVAGATTKRTFANNTYMHLDDRRHDAARAGAALSASGIRRWAARAPRRRARRPPARYACADVSPLATSSRAHQRVRTADSRPFLCSPSLRLTAPSAGCRSRRRPRARRSRRAREAQQPAEDLAVVLARASAPGCAASAPPTWKRKGSGGDATCAPDHRMRHASRRSRARRAAGCVCAVRGSTSGAAGTPCASSASTAGASSRSRRPARELGVDAVVLRAAPGVIRERGVARPGGIAERARRAPPTARRSRPRARATARCRGRRRGPAARPRARDCPRAASRGRWR